MCLRKLYTLGGYANGKLELKEETRGRKSNEEAVTSTQERMVVIGKGEEAMASGNTTSLIFTKIIFSLHQHSNLSSHLWKSYFSEYSQT